MCGYASLSYILYLSLYWGLGHRHNVTSLYGWCSLELISTQPAQQYVAALIMDHESQVHVWLVSGHFISHHGLIWILGSSRGVEWGANCMLISLATHRVSGKQAPVWTSSPCLVCYSACKDPTDCWCEIWEPKKPLAGAKFPIWVFRLASRGENTRNPTALPIMRS